MGMKNPPHPGLIVRHDCLEPIGLSVTKAAKLLGISRSKLSAVVNCQSGIAPELSIRLGKAFGCEPDLLYKVQCAYDLAQVKKMPDKSKLNAYR